MLTQGKPNLFVVIYKITMWKMYKLFRINMCIAQGRDKLTKGQEIRKG